MNSFQIIVLSIFVILAILILTTFTIMLRSKKDADYEHPKSYSQCPDYWDASGNLCVMSSSINNGNWEQNAYNSSNKTGTPGYSSEMYGNTNKPHINFNNNSWNNDKYPGITGRCALKQWANKSNIVWDGVTNYNSAYC